MRSGSKVTGSEVLVSGVDVLNGLANWGLEVLMTVFQNTNASKTLDKQIKMDLKDIYHNMPNLWMEI